MRKDKYIGVLCININGIRSRLKSKRFDPLKPCIQFNSEIFNVDVKFPIYKRGNKFYYYFEKGKGQVFSKTDKLAGNELVVKSLFLEELPRQLTTNLDKSSNIDINNIIFAIMGLLAGTGLGYMIAGMV